MRAWLIQALTGRRASEVLMMDFEPLSEVPGLDPATVPDGGMVARLRYQQTKIDGAPDTILVGADVVQIIREQQAWVRQQWNLAAGATPRYLFPKTTGNRHATRPWETARYNAVLLDFSLALGLRDADGQLLRYSRSHRLRHTKATTLQIGRIAFDASFGSSRERALPAAQRAALRCRQPAGRHGGCGDLGFHGPPVSDATMMRLMPLRGPHHRCGC